MATRNGVESTISRQGVPKVGLESDRAFGAPHLVLGLILGDSGALPAVGRKAKRVRRHGVIHHDVAVEAGRRKVRVAQHVPHGR